MEFEVKATSVTNGLSIVVPSPQRRVGCSAICALHSCPSATALKYKTIKVNYFEKNI